MQVRIREAAQDYTVVYDDTEESSMSVEEEAGGVAARGGGVMNRVLSLERRGVGMQGRSEGSGMFSSNKERVRRLVEEELHGKTRRNQENVQEELRTKARRNQSFKQAVGGMVGGRRRKSLEEQLVRNSQVRSGPGAHFGSRSFS